MSEGPLALIVDNGSHTTKLSLSSSGSPLFFPNSIASSKRYTQQHFVGPQLASLSASLPSLSSFTWKSPCEKGVCACMSPLVCMCVRERLVCDFAQDL